MKMFALAFAAVAGSVSAQDYIPTVQPQIGNWYLMGGGRYDYPLITPKLNGEAANRAKARALARQGSAAVPTAVRSVQLTYTPSIVRRRANLAAFAAKSRAVDPQGAAAMEQLFAGTDVIAALGRDLAPYGLRTDNVADAYSAYWMSAWQAAHQDANDPNRATARAVSIQSANALIATPEFQDANDAQKQELAEALLVQAALISASQAKYKDNAVMAEKLADSVRQGAKASGLDLDAMTLTREGFVPTQ